MANMVIGIFTANKISYFWMTLKAVNGYSNTHSIKTMKQAKILVITKLRQTRHMSRVM